MLSSPAVFTSMAWLSCRHRPGACRLTCALPMAAAFGHCCAPFCEYCHERQICARAHSDCIYRIFFLGCVNLQTKDTHCNCGRAIESASCAPGISSRRACPGTRASAATSSSPSLAVPAFPSCTRKSSGITCLSVTLWPRLSPLQMVRPLFIGILQRALCPIAFALLPFFPLHAEAMSCDCRILIHPTPHRCTPSCCEEPSWVHNTPCGNDAQQACSDQCVISWQASSSCTAYAGVLLACT